MGDIENDERLVNVHFEITTGAAKADGDVIGHHLHGDHRERFALGRIDLARHIDEPGSFSGISSSANPARGPHDISRMSLAILYSETASVRSVPDRWTSAS